MKLTSGLVLLAIFLTVLLCVIVLVLPAQQRADEDYMRNWATAHDCQVINIDRHYFRQGPYWLKGRSDRIYKVQVSGDKTYWFRFSLFSTDVEKE